MKEHLYSVGLEHKKTGERIDLQVWARNTDEATHKLTGVLIWPDLREQQDHYPGNT